MNSYGIDVDAVIRLIVAVALGAAIGTERELTGQTAGLRTSPPPPASGRWQPSA